MNEQKKLYRSDKDKVIFGVCGGLGEYFAIDPLIVRLIFIALSFGGGAGLFIYLIFALLVPLENKNPKVAQTVGGEKKLDNSLNNKDWSLIIGAVLVIIGISALVSNFWSFRFIWSNLWPLLLILAGVMIIFKKK